MNLVFPVAEINRSRLSVLRLDLLPPPFNGNKGFKLKHNIEFALKHNFRHVVSFGGAFSNHLLALSPACKLHNLRLTAMIRGEKPITCSPLLQTLEKNGHAIRYVARNVYREKDTADFLHGLAREFPDALVLPEGGSNALAVKGLAEIHDHIQGNFTAIFTACGTGSTLAGLVSGHREGHAKYYGVSVLKGGEFLNRAVTKFIEGNRAQQQLPSWEILTQYHFGGYAKTTEKLNSFMNNMLIPLDHVYTAKMLYAAVDQMKNGAFSAGSEILAIHTLNG